MTADQQMELLNHAGHEPSQSWVSFRKENQVLSLELRSGQEPHKGLWGKRSGRCAGGQTGQTSLGTLYLATSHGHSEEDLFAVCERTAIHGDVVDPLPGCWSAQAWGLEDSIKGESLCNVAGPTVCPQVLRALPALASLRLQFSSHELLRRRTLNLGLT